MAAYAAGVLLLLTGGTGGVALVRIGWALASQVSPMLGGLLAPLFVAALVVAGLGGFTVFGGAYLLHHHNRPLGKVLIGLGAGAGTVGFVLHLFLVAYAGGDPAEELLTTALTFHGLGVLLAVFAQVTG